MYSFHRCFFPEFPAMARVSDVSAFPIAVEFSLSTSVFNVPDIPAVSGIPAVARFPAVAGVPACKIFFCCWGSCCYSRPALLNSIIKKKHFCLSD
jgi:hypothetical protein